VERERAAPTGLWLVSASQILYLVGAFATGQLDLGTIADAASAGCAAVCASALARGDRASFAWGLLVFAAVQLLDYLVTLFGGRYPAYFAGFTFPVIGLAIVAASASRWRGAAADAPRPQGVRLGAGFASLGAFLYLVAGVMAGGSFNQFTVGAVCAGVGWLLVALA
jgi:hypothetical protein